MPQMEVEFSFGLVLMLKNCYKKPKSLDHANRTQKESVFSYAKSQVQKNSHQNVLQDISGNFV